MPYNNDNFGMLLNVITDSVYNITNNDTYIPPPPNEKYWVTDAGNKIVTDSDDFIVFD
jgi:hypothetical protein